MKFYAQWAEEKELFHKSLKAINDLDVFSFKIWEEEGSIAYAQLKVRNPFPHKEFFNSKPYLILRFEEKGSLKTLFVGHVISCPIQIDTTTLEIGLIAHSRKIEKSLEGLKKELQASDLFDHLYVPEPKRDELSLDKLFPPYCAHLYHDRLTHEVRLSHLLAGVKKDSVPPSYCANSLKMRTVGTP